MLERIGRAMAMVGAIGLGVLLGPLMAAGAMWLQLSIG
jgi:hypothetical protein